MIHLTKSMEEIKMKKILYTLITALLLVSCHDDEMINNIPTPVEEGGQVTVTVGLDIPELQTAGSRALGEFDYSNAAHLPLQLVVFDENGVLTEAKTGDDVKYVKTEGETTVYFNVTLTVTNAKRYIHFILNSPATSYEWGTEDNLIGSLFVSGEQDAYWQRVEFPNGIEATATPDNGVLTYTATDDLIKRMTNVPMLRNFAKISVSTTDAVNALLTDVSYYVVNVWDAGTVAPYYSGDFTDFVNFNNGADAPTRYMQITQQGYEGIEPSGAELIQEGPAKGETSWTVPDDAWLPVTQGTTVGTPFYMYERRNTFVSENVPSTYLVIKGKYKGSSQYSYYKLDLVYTVDETTQQKQYYNILRNFHYAVNIQSVIGAGYGTAYEAATHAASNNLSGSIDLRDLTNISDSQDRLFVEYTDMTIVNNGNLETERTIKYKYIQGSQGDRITNANLTLRELTEDADDKRITGIYYKNTSGTNVSVYNGTWADGYTNNAGIAIDSEGWSTLHIQFGGTPSNTVLTNTLGFYIGNLSREVDYHLRSIMPMIVECKPSKVPTGVKQSVAANILIPTGITGANDPYQLFPLEFWVEAEALTISPDVVSNEAAIKQSPYEMPVESGTSIIPSKAEKNKQTFRYKRTITNEEYQSLPTKEVTVNYDMDGNGTAEEITETYRIIPCHFLTNTTNSASKVYAQNDYFTLIKEGNFVNGTQDIKNATLTDTGIYGVGQAATLSFTAVTEGTYTITSGNLSEPSRSVSQEVIFNANESKTINLVTATWEKTSMVTITAPGETKSEYDVMAKARTILPMKATTTLNGVAFTTNPTFYVYTDKSSAMAMTDNKVTDVTNADLTSANGTSKEIAGLKENTELWFAYQSGGFIYVASTTAGELAAKSAVLAFTDANRVEIPLEWSAELTGEQYYGGLNLGGQQYPNAVKTVTLNFETTKTGEYTIVFKEGTYETEKIIDVTDVSVNQTVTYSTLTWSDAISATITYSNEESSYYGSTLDVTGDKRNVLWVKANSITGTNLGNNTTIKITENVITTETSWNNTTVLKETNANELRNGIEIPIDDLDWNKTLYLNYRYRPNRYTGYNYYRLNISAYQLTSNVDISGFQN